MIVPLFFITIFTPCSAKSVTEHLSEAKCYIKKENETEDLTGSLGWVGDLRIDIKTEILGLNKVSVSYALKWALLVSQPDKVINRPGVAGAVLQTPPSLIHSISESKYLPNTLNPKPEELGC